MRGRFFLFFLFFFFSFFLFSSFSFAQEKTATTSSFDFFATGWIDDLWNRLFGKKVPEGMEGVSQAYLPPKVVEKRENVKEKDIPEIAGYYQIRSAGSLTQKESTQTGILGFLKRLFGQGEKSQEEVAKDGHQAARKMVKTELPQVLGEKVAKEEPMTEALDARTCMTLPGGLCNEKYQLSSLPRKEKEESGVSPPSEEEPPESIFPPPIAVDDDHDDKTLDYEIPFYKLDEESSRIIEEHSRLAAKNLREKLARAVANRWPTSMIFYWEEIFQTSYQANWNPALIIALWIEETAASDACTLKTRQGVDGIYDIGAGTEEKTYCSDPLAVKLEKLRRQLRLVLGMKEYWKLTSFREFMCYYAVGHYPCTFETRKGFVERLPTVYNCLLLANAQICPVGYFQFSPEERKEEFVYYSQQDPQYAFYPPSSSCNLKRAGCGPTTVAIVKSSYLDRKYDPIFVIDHYYGGKVGEEKEGRCTGTSLSQARKILQENGLRVGKEETIFAFYKKEGEGIVPDPKPESEVLWLMKNYLEEGWTIFALAKINEIYHFFWIVGINEQNHLLSLDPWYGFGRPYPLDATLLNPLYVSAFVVKKP